VLPPLITLSARDLRTVVAERGWLNDEVVNCYLQLLTRQPDASCDALSSFFLPKLLGHGYDYAAVRRWTRRLPRPLLHHALVLVPVNHGNTHWSLLAVRPQSRRIEHFDSLPGASHRRLLAVLARYLQDEAADKATPGDWHRWQLVERPERVPSQGDAYACGVFICAFAARLVAGWPLAVAQKDVPRLRRRIAAECVAGRAMPLE